MDTADFEENDISAFEYVELIDQYKKLVDDGEIRYSVNDILLIFTDFLNTVTKTELNNSSGLINKFHNFIREYKKH